MTNDKQSYVETMQERTTVYRPGNQVTIWGINLETKDVERDDLQAALADGWFDHPFKARDAYEAEKLKIQKELEDADDEKKALEEANKKAALTAQAKGLGIEVDGRWGIAKLEEAIAKAKSGE